MHGTDCCGRRCRARPIGESGGGPGEEYLDPDELADTSWHLVEQDDPSTQPFEVHVTNGPQPTEFVSGLGETRRTTTVPRRSV